MTATHKIEDAGEKLGGARKDMATTNAGAGEGVHQEALLELLWPKPARWTDLTPSLGANRAALVMVTYENLARKAHCHGWLGVDGAHWERAYRFGISVMRDVLLQPGKPVLDELQEEYDRRMRELEVIIATPPRFANQWSYAIGSAGTRTNRHPLNFTPIDGLRAKYLGEWGWGSDPRVSNSLSMGALLLKHRDTGRRFWKAVKGESGRWAYLNDERFETEQEALDCVRKEVRALLDAPATERGAKRKDQNNWIRKPVVGDGIRSGFASPNSQARTQLDLLDTFGFRGVEFGKWVSQPERQQFVDTAFDAFQDLTQLLGMPPPFASLNGKLGLAYGSRGQGLSKAAAHFEPEKWILHFTKESGAGSVCHEFGHAIDAWVAERLWGKSSRRPRFASGHAGWGGPQDASSESQAAYALKRWRELTDPFCTHLSWVHVSTRMDHGRKTAYWSDPCEMFARAFEVLVMDSLKAKGRHNDMLVHGISDADGQALSAAGKRFPYPMGGERHTTCEAVAAVVRAYRNEFRLAAK